MPPFAISPKSLEVPARRKNLASARVPGSQSDAKLLLMSWDNNSALGGRFPVPQRCKSPASIELLKKKRARSSRTARSLGTRNWWLPDPGQSGSGAELGRGNRAAGVAPRGVPNVAKLAWVRVCAPLPVRLLNLYVSIDRSSPAAVAEMLRWFQCH